MVGQSQLEVRYECVFESRGLKSTPRARFATLTEDRRKIPNHEGSNCCRQYDAFKAKKFFLSPIRRDRATLAHSYYLNPCGIIPKPKLSATTFPGTLGEAPGAPGLSHLRFPLRYTLFHIRHSLRVGVGCLAKLDSFLAGSYRLRGLSLFRQRARLEADIVEVLPNLDGLI